MTNPITDVNVNTISAPTPDNLQNTGAIVSVGGTTLAAGTTSLLQSMSDLLALLRPAAAITSITWLSSVATVTTAAAHGIPTGSTMGVTIAGAVPAGYNGTFIATSTGANTFTYPLTANPGTETTPGTWVPSSAANLVAKNNTFWGQGSQCSVYVLELGLLSPDLAVAALSTYIGANTGQFYAFLVPGEWDSLASYLTLVGGFETATSKLYFFTRTITANIGNYTAAMKDVFAMVQAPATPSTEWTVAWPFRNFLNFKPSAANKVTPFSFNFGFGVTSWPKFGNGSTLTSFLAANINYAGEGSEGGTSNVILRNGRSLDGNPMNYWYSVDWVQINLDRNTTNAVEQGSNNSSNPLYYNQDGINRLQRVGLTTMQQGVSFGLVLQGNCVQTQLSQSDFIAALEAGTYDGMTVINAVPFLIYTAANPADYAQGLYIGLSVAYVPATGFQKIIYTVTVSNIVNS